MPALTYTLNIPAAQNNPSADQPDMKINTNSIDSLLNVDHFTFAFGNAGWHRQVTLPIEPTPTSLAGQAVMYANTSGQSQLFATTDAGGKAYQLTNFNDSLFSKFGSSTGKGWTFLPGGMILNFGFLSTPASSPSSGTITFPRPYTTANINIFGNLYFSGTTPDGSNTWYYRTDTVGMTTFQWANVGGSHHVDGFPGGL